MTVSTPTIPAIFYPSEDGEPLAETSVHVKAIITLVVLLGLYLQKYLQDRSPLILTNQFVYYVEHRPDRRIAPDVAVVFGVVAGERDNYKIWEEGSVPAVIFEITSPSTRKTDQHTKKDLYESLGVLEYWLFDPKGEWLPQQLQGYRLQDQGYEPILDHFSQVLGLRLEVEGMLLGLYRGETGEKLLLPDELAAALEREVAARQAAELRAEQAQRQAEQAQERAERLAEQLRQLGIDPWRE